MKRLVLAGGGLARLHVLKMLAERSWPAVVVLLVASYPRQSNPSIMAGRIAEHYRLDECIVELAPLVCAAGKVGG